MLSRPRSLGTLRSVGLAMQGEKMRALIEGGAPEALAQSFHELFDEKIVATKEFAKKQLSSMASCLTSSGTAELLVGKSSSAEQPVPHSASAGSSEQQPAVCAEQPAKQENANMMVAHL